MNTLAIKNSAKKVQLGSFITLLERSFIYLCVCVDRQEVWGRIPELLLLPAPFGVILFQML